MAAVTGMRGEPLLRTRGLSRHFGGLKAVDDVDFMLETGEIRALIGPNGAGKTTFVSLLAGRIAPTGGTIALNGRDITALPAPARVRAGIAYTFQITSIYAGLSVADNVALGAQTAQGAGRGQGSIAARVDHALDRVGLGGRGGEVAGGMAYGHQRLLEIAMGLALEPRLLILDEPTQGLSEGEIEGFCALVPDVARNATVLLIEHNMAVVMRLAGRISVLEAGRLLAEGTPEEIRADPAVQAAYLGSA